MKNSKILVVDDDQDILTMLQDRLAALQYEVLTATDGPSALSLIERDMPDMLLLDLEMPRMTGMEIMKRLGEARSSANGAGLPIVVMTAHATIARAVEAMKAGALDFITKPFDMDHLAIVVRKALEREHLIRQVASLRDELETRYAQIIGNSARTQSVIEMAKRAAHSDACVLLLGESGTGKELFARSMHHWSARQGMPFVVINCVALTETLLENELFGHERGSYTGADRLQKGKLEMADGGTVFLDEIGDMPMPLQAKLLRVLQDHEFHRLGGSRLVRVNIRVIAATNKDLKQAVRAGTFREDLYYRLNVVTLTLPPLRERREDIPQLAEFFLRRHARDAKRPHARLTPDALAAMQAYAWPGNIRELDNAVARAVILSPDDAIGAEPLALSDLDLRHPADSATDPLYLDLPYHESMEEHSRHVILRALRLAQGSQTKAAERLHLQRTYLSRLIKQRNLSLD